jgi:hypothetical protein
MRWIGIRKPSLGRLIERSTLMQRRKSMEVKTKSLWQRIKDYPGNNPFAGEVPRGPRFEQAKENPLRERIEPIKEFKAFLNEAALRFMIFLLKNKRSL